MTDCCTMLREIVDPKFGDRVKTVIDRASKETGIPYVRVREIWYGNARRIEQHEYEKIRAAFLRKQIKVAQNVEVELDAVISRLKALLRAVDEDYHSPTIDALGTVRGRVV